MSSNLIAKYIWEMNLLMEKPHSLNEIADKWCRSADYDDKELSRKTFFNHRKAIASNFSVDIDYDYRTRKYFISEENKNALHRIRQIINVFSVRQAVGDTSHLKDRILFEDIPSGQIFLQPIIKAMKTNNVIKLEYQKFGEAVPKEVRIEPYALKIVEQRWYLTGNVDGRIHNYALDRMVSATPTDDVFSVPQDFDARTYFEDFYGVFTDRSVPLVDVKIRTNETMANYLNTLPLHASQQCIAPQDDDGSFVFLFHLRPTPDFIMQIMRLGEDAEVLSPEWLRMEVAKKLRSALKQYE